MERKSSCSSLKSISEGSVDDDAESKDNDEAILVAKLGNVELDSVSQNDSHCEGVSVNSSPSNTGKRKRKLRRDVVGKNILTSIGRFLKQIYDAQEASLGDDAYENGPF